MQFSQRGVLNLAHDLGDIRTSKRRVYANALDGVDAEWLYADEVKAFVPIVNVSEDVPYPVLGGTLQRLWALRVLLQGCVGVCPRRRSPGRRHRL